MFSRESGSDPNLKVDDQFNKNPTERKAMTSPLSASAKKKKKRIEEAIFVKDRGKLCVPDQVHGGRGKVRRVMEARRSVVRDEEKEYRIVRERSRVVIFGSSWP